MLVLGWLRGDAVERALTHMLGRPGVQHELLEAIVRFGAPMVDRLVGQLRSDDLDTRRAAVIALGRIGDARAVAPLVALLEDDDRELLVTATAALARIGDGRAFEALLRLLGDADLSVRHGAIGALNSIGHLRWAPACSRCSGRRSARARSSSVAATSARRLCAALLDATVIPTTVHAAALEHIAYLDDERSVPILVPALANDTAGAGGRPGARAYRRAALDALRQAGGDRSWVRYFAPPGVGGSRVVASGADGRRGCRATNIAAINDQRVSW